MTSVCSHHSAYHFVHEIHRAIDFSNMKILLLIKCSEQYQEGLWRIWTRPNNYIQNVTDMFGRQQIWTERRPSVECCCNMTPGIVLLELCTLLANTWYVYMHRRTVPFTSANIIVVLRGRPGFCHTLWRSYWCSIPQNTKTHARDRLIKCKYWLIPEKYIFDISQCGRSPFNITC